MPCSPRMLRCHRRCRHRDMVQAYRAARAAAEQQREQECAGYAAEEAEHGPIITFKSWLIAQAAS